MRSDIELDDEGTKRTAPGPRGPLGAGSMGIDTLGRGTLSPGNGLGASGDATSSPTTGLGALGPAVGTTKQQLVDALERVRARGMRFRAVVAQACKSGLPSHLDERLPANVKSLFHSGANETGYRSVDYSALTGIGGPEAASASLETAVRRAVGRGAA